jgi:hypothetical protein
MRGYIYILSNPSMPGILKIGKTERDPDERISELSNVSGVPTPFYLEYKIFVPDCHSAEKSIHEALKAMRVSDRREFFDIIVSDAIDIVKSQVVTNIAKELLKYDNDLLSKIIDYVFMRNKTVKMNLK